MSISHQQQAKAERDEKMAENIRYGQNISEQDMGGKTTTSSGSANQGILHLLGSGFYRLIVPHDVVDGYGLTDVQTEHGSAEDSRQEQGYGEGSGVGA